MAQMTERLQTVIDAAERAAEAIRYDAEEQARRHLAEAQRKADRMTAERVRLISELTDDLIRHAGQVRDHSEQMVHSLEDAIDSVSGKLSQPGLSAPFTVEDMAVAPDVETHQIAASSDAGASTDALPAPVSAPEHSPAAAASPPPAPPSTSPAAAPVSQEALLHATRLAVAGHDRETIAATLHDEFGVADPGPVLDRVLGAA